MPTMHLLVRGAYEDAFLYMDHLFLLRDDAVMEAWPLGETLDGLGDDLRPIATLAIERNDLLSERGSQLLLSSRRIRRQIELSFGRGPIELELPGSAANSEMAIPDQASSSALLDLLIYNRRVYVGSTNGLHSADLHQDSWQGTLSLGQFKMRSDARCVAINARYGSVAASCGEDGLFLFFGEFDEGRIADSEASELDAASQRTAWLGYNLVNYRSPIDRRAFKAAYKSVGNRGNGRASVELTDLSANTDLLAKETGDAKDDFLFNSHTLFFAHIGGRYELRKRRWSGGHLGGVEEVSTGRMALPLSAHPLGDGLVLETFDSVEYIDTSGRDRLVGDEALSVRTFPGSVRYRQVVAVVTDEGVHLLGRLPNAE